MWHTKTHWNDFNKIKRCNDFYREKTPIVIVQLELEELTIQLVLIKKINQIINVNLIWWLFLSCTGSFYYHRVYLPTIIITIKYGWQSLSRLVANNHNSEFSPYHHNHLNWVHNIIILSQIQYTCILFDCNRNYGWHKINNACVFHGIYRKQAGVILHNNKNNNVYLCIL